jgi:hypothetical protein
LSFCFEWQKIAGKTAKPNYQVTLYFFGSLRETFLVSVRPGYGILTSLRQIGSLAQRVISAFPEVDQSVNQYPDSAAFEPVTLTPKR